MPAKSQQQQKFMGMVHALNKGDIKPSDVSKSVRDVAKNIKKSDAKDFASTKHNKIPKKVKQEILNALKEYANKMSGNKLGGGGSHGYAPQKGLRDDDGYDNEGPKDESVNENSYLKNAQSRLKKVYKHLGVEYGQTRRGDKYVQINYIPKSAPQSQQPEFVKVFYKDDKELQKIGKTLKLKLKESVNERMDKRQAGELIKQLGGNRFIAMTGAKNFVVGPKGAGFKIGKNSKGINYVRIDLDGRDLYNMEFIQARGGNMKVKSKEKGVYFDQLRKLFTKNTGMYTTLEEGMFSTLDQIRQDSKDVRDFVKNVFKDRDFMKMKNDKEFIKYLKSIYEGVDESKGVPQNYMQGRTSDYHTALRGKNRDYSGGTNFKKTNHGQPDIENAEEDEEVGLTNKQTKIETPKSLSEKFKVAGRPVKINKGKKKNGTDWTVTFKNGKTVPLSDVLSLIKPLPKLTKEEMGNLSSSERIELYKLYSKAMKAMPGSPNQKKIKVLINKLRKKADLKPLPINEVKVETERYFGKKGIIIMIRDGNKLISAIFKDKKNADKFNRNKPSDVKKLYQLAKKTKFPKTIDEYGQRLDLSFIDDKEARLKGTPKPKDAINRDIDEYLGGSYEYTKGDQYGQNSVDEGTMIRLAGQIAQELLPKDTWSRYANDGRKNKEFVKNIVRDLAQTLNHFYKSHNISVKIKENNTELNEIGVFPVQNYFKGILPSKSLDISNDRDRERVKSLIKDLVFTLNDFWKSHKIPFRVREPRKSDLRQFKQKNKRY